MATLIITAGPADGQRLALESHRLIMIGRDHSCTFQVLDPRLSRRHLQLMRDDNGEHHYAIDFGSANGVFVNDERIADKTQLGDGDVLRIGATQMIYSVEDDPSAQKVGEWLRRHGPGFSPTQVIQPGSGMDMSDVKSADGKDNSGII